MTPGTPISIGRESVKGVFLRSRGPIALVRLNGREKPQRFLLSSCKPLPESESKIIQLHVEQSAT